jgi:hypothetical protein
MAFRPCSRKLFVMANKVCTPFSAASKLFERVSESAHWDRQHLLSIMGYNGAGVTRPRSSSSSGFFLKFPYEKRRLSRQA